MLKTLSSSILLLTLLSSTAVQSAPTSHHHKGDLEKELKKLETEGDSVVKTAEVHTKIVNGQKTQHSSHSETGCLSRPKLQNVWSLARIGYSSVGHNGKVIGAVKSEADAKNDEPPKVKTEVHLPPQKKSGQDEQGQEEDEMVSPEEIARYIYETGDVDSVKEALEKIVTDKKLTEEESSRIMVEVEMILQQMQEAMMEQEKSDQKAEEEAFHKMLQLAAELSRQQETRDQLHNIAKQLYILYEKEGDVRAKMLLSKFTDILENQAQEKTISPNAETVVLETVLSAMKEVDGDEEDSEVKEGKEAAGDGPAASSSAEHDENDFEEETAGNESESGAAALEDEDVNDLHHLAESQYFH